MFSLTGKNKKQIVGVAITPNLGLEVCLYDVKNGEVAKYGQKFVEYNIASKEIQDMNTFRSMLSDTFNELDIDKNAAEAFFVLPNVYFGFRSIEDPFVESDEIENMIYAAASESYIFKKEEPQSAWFDLNSQTGTQTKYIAYSSFQKSVVEAIEDACMDVGISIIGIESYVTAIPRGVYLTGFVNDEIDNSRNWVTLVVNPNNYAIIQMSGARILDYLEVPFAIMSFDCEEVYGALSSALQQYLPNYPAKKLVIVSQTDNVSATLLKNELVFDGDVVAIESNKHGKIPCVTVDGNIDKQVASSMTMGVLGASNPGLYDFVTLNVLGNASYDGVSTYGTFISKGVEVPLTSTMVVKTSLTASIILGILVAVFCGSLFLVSTIFNNKAKSEQAKIDSLNSEIKALEEKLNSGVGPLVKSINEANKTAINFYDSLSVDIPSELWLTYYFNKNGSDVAIEGYSLNINDVYEYFKSLKTLLPKSTIKLNKLDVFDENTRNKLLEKRKKDGNNNKDVDIDIDSLVLELDGEQQAFAFEISNTTYVKRFNIEGNPKSDKVLEKQTKELQEALGGSNKKNVSKAAKIPDIPDVGTGMEAIE